MTVTLPEEAEDWPFEARHMALSEANSVADIQNEIAAIVGPEYVSETDESTKSNALKKQELAAILMALGGPQGDN